MYQLCVNLYFAVNQNLPVPPKHSYRANGKVLMSGEYLVMNGALALGLPLSVGQSLMVKESSGSEVVWKSLRPDGSIWFSGRFDLFGFDCIKTTDEEIAASLKQILESAVRLNSEFLSKWKKYTVETALEFEPHWGLGSSSTLISCLARWADVDPYDLQEVTFGGSGYDIACATAEAPIHYRLDDTSINVERANFSPIFSDQIYFIYLGQKQNSRTGLDAFSDKKVPTTAIEEVSQISKSMCEVSELKLFEELVIDHELLVSEIIERPRIKTQFSDFWGEIKSLGAWGGDFIMATSNRSAEETQAYFCNKGLDIFFSYDQLAISAAVAEQA